MPVTNIQQGKRNRGQTYMGTCPRCGLRKRLGYAVGERDGKQLWLWQFWCSTKCGYTEVIGTEAELKASLNARRATAE